MIQELSTEMVRTEPEPGLKLHINSSTVDDPTLPVRWCLKRPAIEYLREQSTGTTLVLLTQTQIMSAGHVEEIRGARRLLPLNDAMTYLQLRRAGHLSIHAILIHINGDTWRVKNRLLSRNAQGSYEYSLFYRGDEYRYQSPSPTSVTMSDINVTFVAHAEIQVDVEANMFAKEPAAWLKSYVNWLFDRPPIDECDFRKRMIFAFTLQPLIWFVWSIIITLAKGVCALWLFLSGWRQLDLKDAVPPVWSWSRFNSWLKEPLSDVWCSEWWHRTYSERRKTRSIFRYNELGNQRPFFMRMWQPTFMPLIAAAVLALTQTVPWMPGIQTGATPVDGVMFLLTMLCLIALPSAINYSFWESVESVLRVLDRYQAKRRRKQPAPTIVQLESDSEKIEREAAERAQDEEWRKRRIEAAAQQQRAQREAQLAPLACTGQITPVDLAHAPRRTIRLRFDAFKARVCRPFAR